MTKCLERYRLLTLSIPIQGKGFDGAGDPWLAGRTKVEVNEHIFRTLGHVGGLQEAERGQMTGKGNLQEINYSFFYEDLTVAVHQFANNWLLLDFPDRTRLTHVERLPADPFFRHHVMIRWIDGRMDPFSTILSDSNLLTPQTA